MILHSCDSFDLSIVFLRLRYTVLTERVCMWYVNHPGFTKYCCEPFYLQCYILFVTFVQHLSSCEFKVLYLVLFIPLYLYNDSMMEVTLRYCKTKTNSVLETSWLISPSLVWQNHPFHEPHLGGLHRWYHTTVAIFPPIHLEVFPVVASLKKKRINTGNGPFKVATIKSWQY